LSKEKLFKVIEGLAIFRKISHNGGENLKDIEEETRKLQVLGKRAERAERIRRMGDVKGRLSELEERVSDLERRVSFLERSL